MKKKNAPTRCPYCGKAIHYISLWGSKRNDYGCCPHCGGIYAVAYSPLAYLLTAAVAVLFAGVFAFHYLANKTLPGAGELAVCALAAVAVYFVLPLAIVPRRCKINGLLGGFPDETFMPPPPVRRRSTPGDDDAVTEEIHLNFAGEGRHAAKRGTRV